LHYNHHEATKEVHLPLVGTGELKPNMGEEAKCEFNGGEQKQENEVDASVISDNPRILF
jgi:hypothetical protein